jgi:hypothetical protein
MHWREVARRFASIADREKSSDDFLARVRSRARLARHALDEKIEVCRVLHRMILPRRVWWQRPIASSKLAQISRGTRW